MQPKTPTGREIIEMWDLVRVCSPGIDGAAIEQKAQLEAQKLSNIIVELHNIHDKMGTKKINTILENIFKNALAIKSFQRRIRMYALHENRL